MLTTLNNPTSFDQFLFSHFKINEAVENAMEPVLEMQESASRAVAKCKGTVKRSVKRVKKTAAVPTETPLEVAPVLALDSQPIVAKASAKEKYADLAEVIDSIPDKVRAMNIEELAHKHESEWYHAFRDLKDEISRDITKKHPEHLGTLKLKSEIKEFTELLDEHIEKAILELERIFQAFPTMSRVAVIYLLSLIISIPLMFFSVSTGKSLPIDYPGKLIGSAASHSLEITQEMKSEYIAKNSAKILASGQTTFAVKDMSAHGRVAGVYEESNPNELEKNIKEKLSVWYRYLADIKDELGNIFSRN